MISSFASHAYVPPLLIFFRSARTSWTTLSVGSSYARQIWSLYKGKYAPHSLPHLPTALLSFPQFPSASLCPPQSLSAPLSPTPHRTPQPPSPPLLSPHTWSTRYRIQLWLIWSCLYHPYIQWNNLQLLEYWWREEIIRVPRIIIKVLSSHDISMMKIVSRESRTVNRGNNDPGSGSWWGLAGWQKSLTNVNEAPSVPIKRLSTRSEWERVR